MPDRTTDLLQQAWLLIQANRKDEALAIVKPICIAEPDNARAWFTAANALDDIRLKQIALQRTLQADPTHDLALQELHRLKMSNGESGSKTAEAWSPGGIIVPARRADPLIADDLADNEDYQDSDESNVGINRRKSCGKKPQKTKPSLQRDLKVAGVVAVEIVLIAIIYILFFLPTSPPPQPMLGPYYPRKVLNTYPSNRPPCAEYILTGHIVDGSGLVVHAWNNSRSLDIRLDVDAQGDYTSVVPSSRILTNANDAAATEDFHLRLYDADNKPMSGITDVSAYHSCVQASRFQRYGYQPSAPLLSDEQRRYTVTYSEPTESTVYDCRLTGFIGNIFNDKGPVDGFFIEVWELGVANRIYQAVSGSSPELGPGAWGVVVPPGKSYVVNIRLPDGRPLATPVIFLPVGDCKTRLIRVAVTQYEP